MNGAKIYSIMATENVNGIYGQNTHPPPASDSKSDVSKEEVGWYFVERYYNTLSKSPDKLHLFFGKASQFVAGVEEEKVQVQLGQRAIDERIRELKYQDCKVRITNVDTQASGDNIVIQIIGAMSNQSAPHRKFVQTFVLAPQTNGWYVLNDIFRYTLEETDEPVAQEAVTIEDQPEATPLAVEEPVEEAIETATPLDVAEVDTALEETKEEAPKTNGTEEEEVAAPVPAVEETPFDDSSVKVEAPVVEKTHEPTPSPKPEVKVTAPAPEKAAAAPQPSKPSGPKTWASMFSGGKAAAAAAAAATPATPSPAPASKAAAPAPVTKAAAPAAKAITPARQPSPASSNQDGSTGGWQTADHTRNKSRSGPVPDERGRVRAYVKNVYAHIDEQELRNRLSKFGELLYFDVARQKVCFPPF
jgi:hypothetical protein